jgi:hypothetical protein
VAATSSNPDTGDITFTATFDASGNQVGGDQAKVVPGGIDFAQSNLDMQIKRDGNGVVLPISQQNLDNIKIDGLVPVILDIKPASTLPLFASAK